MTTEILKEKIHSLVDASSEDVLESVYQLLQVPDYTTAFKNVLNEEFIRTHGKPDVIIADPPRAGMHEDVTRKILETLWGDIEKYYNEWVEKAWQEEVSRIWRRFHELSQNRNQLLIELWIWSDDEIDFKKRVLSHMRHDTFMWRAIMQDWASDIRKAFIETCQKDRIHPHFEIIQEWRPQKKQLHITCSLKWESWISGSIMSTDSAPYFKIQLPGNLAEWLKQWLIWVLQELFILTGMLGKWYLEPKKPSEKRNEWWSTRTGKEIQGMMDLLSWKKKRTIVSLHELEKGKRDSIVEAIRRFQEGRWKILTAEWFDEVTGYYRCNIQSRKWLDALEKTEWIRIVLKDETISALKWQDNVGDMIIKNDRLKKFFYTYSFSFRVA